MDVQFPQDVGYAGFFIVGFRKRPDQATQTQRTGTAILKRTYTVDPVAGTLTPSPAPLPIFLQSRPDNLSVNGDFEQAVGGEQDAWRSDGAAIALAPTLGVAGNALRVSGAANARAVQTIEVPEPLGGRQFILSLSARADAATARIEGVQLEADGADAPICVLNADLTTAMSRRSASGTWPAGLAATSMRLVLRAPTSTARAALYDQVQVEERTFLTRFDPDTTAHFEDDLAPFKPEADVVVLGFTDIGGTSRVRVDGVVWLQRTLAGPREKALFGWQPRLDPPRSAQAGGYSPNAADYPPEFPPSQPIRDPLPGGAGDPRPPFDNRFYNGYRRDAAQLAAQPYPDPDATIEVVRDAGSDYLVQLRGDAPAARLHYYRGSGEDAEHRWLSEAVPMRLDTVVVEPDADRCSVVWRGVWPFDDHPEADYRRLSVTGPA